MIVLDSHIENQFNLGYSFARRTDGKKPGDMNNRPISWRRGFIMAVEDIERERALYVFALSGQPNGKWERD